MQKLITKYGLAAHLAFLAVAPLFLYPVCVLWLALLGATWLVMEPSRVGGEMLHDARRRVFATAVRDPLLWVLLAVVAFAAVRCLNDGVAMAYDTETSAWYLRGPVVPCLPGSTSDAGVGEFAVSVVLLVVVVGCRFSLGKSARQAFLVLVAVFVGIMGLVLACLHYDGNAVVRDLATFEMRMPIHLGIVFGLGLLTATVAMMSAYELVWRKALLLLLFALAGTASGLVIFAPVWTVVVFLAADVLLFLFSFVYAKLTQGGNNEFKFLVSFGLGLVLAGIVAVGVVSESALLEKVDSVRQGRYFPPEYAAARKTLSAVSQTAWKAHPWIGTGLGSFPHVLRFTAKDEDWKTIPPDQSCALNGYWQFLVERGIVSCLVVLGPLAILLLAYVRQLVIGVRCRLPPPSAWIGLVVLVAVLVLMAADCSVFYPGVSALTAAILAISANSFPKEKAHG